MTIPGMDVIFAVVLFNFNKNSGCQRHSYGSADFLYGIGFF
jgi:hypothetical protein